MSQLELLQLVLTFLRSVGAEAMVVGSCASGSHGEGRSSHNVDLVVDLPENQVDAFIGLFDRDRYSLSESAFAERRMANVIDTHTGDKVDLFFLRDDPDSRREFSRRISGVILGVEVDVMTVEDTIISKLRWDQQIGGSELQRSDIQGLVVGRRDSLDWEYVWANVHGNMRTTLETLVESTKEAE